MHTATRHAAISMHENIYMHTATGHAMHEYIYTNTQLLGILLYLHEYIYMHTATGLAAISYA